MAEEPQSQWRLFRSFRGRGKGAWRYDLVAGLTLAAIAVPEQMATARLGGFPAHIGFFAFIAGSVAFAVFGSNRYLSSGADSTITPIFAGALSALVSLNSDAYPQLAVLLALAVGLLLTLAGLFRAGWVADLLSIPVMTGFLAGIAIHIAVSQAPALLGLPSAPGGVLESLTAVWRKIGDANPYALTIGFATLLCISLCEWINPRIPGALISLAAATFAVDRFDLVEKGVAVVGGFKVALPRLAMDPMIWDDLPRVFGLAVVVAVVVMVQTAAVSRSFPNAPGQSPDVDRDFLGLGVGSLLAALVGAFPVNASPPRTAIVFETDARSQGAAIVACLAVLAIVIFGPPLLEKAPEAALAGVMFFVAGRLIRLREIRAISARARAEFLLVVSTALLVTILPVQTGVALAILLSLAHGVFTTTRTRLIEFERLPGASIWWPQSWSLAGEKLEGVVVVAFQAPLSFLNAYGFRRDLEQAIASDHAAPVRLVILEAGSNVEIDYTAARILDETIRRCRARGVDFAIARLESVRAQAALRRFGVSATLGEGHLFHSVDEATRALAPDAAVRPA